MASNSWNKIETALDQVASSNNIVTTPKKTCSNPYDNDQSDDVSVNSCDEKNLQVSSNLFGNISGQNSVELSSTEDNRIKATRGINPCTESEFSIDINNKEINCSVTQETAINQTVDSSTDKLKSDRCTSVVINMEEEPDDEVMTVKVADSGSETDFEEEEVSPPSDEIKINLQKDTKDTTTTTNLTSNSGSISKKNNQENTQGTSKATGFKLAPIFNLCRKSYKSSIERGNSVVSNTTTIDNKSTERNDKKEEEENNDDDKELDDNIPSETRVYSEKEKRNKEFKEKIKSINERNLIEFKGLRKFSANDKIFPFIRSGDMHTVTVRLMDDFQPSDVLEPYPSTFDPRWDSEHVPLPCNKENVRPRKVRVRIEDSEVGDERRGNKPNFTEVKEYLWDKIQAALSHKNFECAQDIGRAMKSYNRNVDDELNILDHTIEKVMTEEESSRFFTEILPGMIDLCLDLPNIVTCPLPLLSRFKNHSITLSQKQIACLLANAFFCTFPKLLENEDEYPGVDFTDLLSGDDRVENKAHKLRCILHYFERVITEMPRGLVTFTRRSIKPSNMPVWNKSDQPITKLVTLNEGSIETEGEGFLQIDFANKYVGGGVLGNGCVQEEILFVIYPELIVSRLFTARLVAGESLVVTGCERFSRYKGYARSFQFDGDFIDTAPWDKRARKCTQIVAIDALMIKKTEEQKQFHPKHITRETNKAYTGFSYPYTYVNNPTHSVAVATGKWGCGAFGGDAHLKAVIQLMAASEVGRDVIFFTFGDAPLQLELEEIYAAIKDKTIRSVWNLLIQYNRLYCTQSNKKRALNLHQFIVEISKTLDDINDIDMDDDDDDLDFRSTTSSKSSKSDERRNNNNSGDNKDRTNETSSSYFKTNNHKSREEDDKDWLQKMEETKANWSSKGPQQHKLSDNEISNIVNDDGFDEEENDTSSTKKIVSRSCTNSSNTDSTTSSMNNITSILESELEKSNTTLSNSTITSNKKHEKTIPFLKPTGSVSSPKRCNPLSPEVKTNSSKNSSPSNTEFPKQKQQKIMPDFYVP